MNKHDILMKSKIRKKTECTVFFDTVTIIADIIAIIENAKKNIEWAIILIICRDCQL